MSNSDLHTCPKCGGSNFSSRGLIAHQPYCQGEPDDLPSPTTVITVTPAKPVKPSGKTTSMDSQAQLAPLSLSSLAATANEAIDIISRHESAFEAATLEHRLILGQQMAIAQEAFGLTFEERASVASQMAAAVRNGLAAEAAELERTGGFGCWLALHCPRLPRPTAIKYANAYRGTRLPLDATMEQIQDRLEAYASGTIMLTSADPEEIVADDAARQPQKITLAALIKVGKPSKEEAYRRMKEGIRKAPCYDPEMQLRDAREMFYTLQDSFRESINKGHMDHLDLPALNDLKEFHLWLRDRINARLQTVGK